jgi:hypothetical protein
MPDKVTLAISLPINGTSWDRAAAISEAISAASMRGDSLGAMALGQLLSDVQMPHAAVQTHPNLIFDPNSASGYRVAPLR